MKYDDELRKFLKKRRLRRLSEKTLIDDENQIRQFLRFVEDKEITSDLVSDYLELIIGHTYTRKGKQYKYSEYSIYQIETKIRLFLNSINPELCVDVQPRMPKKSQLPKNLLNVEDIEKLLNACHTLRDKALIAFLFESGVRKGELFSIRIENVVFDENGAVVTIPTGKTGARRIRVVFSASFLRQYIENHPCTDTESPLFCSTREPYVGLSDSGLKEQLLVIAKRAKVNKPINPHAWRHAAATRLAQHLTEQQMKSYLGWTAGSSMASVYVHLAGSDVDPAILKMNGIAVDETSTPVLKVGKCTRCKEVNPETSAYCGKCGMPLKDETKRKLDSELAEIDMTIMSAIAENPAILVELAERVSKLQNNKSQDRL